ncbi:MAG: hypothetical protein K0V04_17080, partial [Deltaproteobacteria bacterium]|nr:hypothetical protein [Deltaproteobacteria bacterium]
MGWGLLVAGCPGDGDGSGGGTDEASTGTDAMDSDDDGPSDDGTGTTTMSPSTGEPLAPGMARGGIVVDWVEANQGVGVDIGRDGGEVGPGDRPAPLISHRDTLIRAFWSLPDDWQPREIEARLIVTSPDGTERTFSDIKMIDSEPFESELSGSFFWGLLADETIPGLRYRVELWETTTDFEDQPAPEPAPQLPVDGSSAFVGIEDSYQVMKVVLVPFHYDDGEGCVSDPDASNSTMQFFQNFMFQQNPLDRLEFEVHEPIDWNTPLDDLAELNAYLVGLRFDEGALPEAYYYGLIHTCSDTVGGAYGLATGIPTSPVNVNAAAQRVSSGVSLQPAFSAETFVHEVGHSQGRRHVTCNGAEQGVEPMYPHEGGAIGGRWGFGIIDFQLRHPVDTKDYMTYCQPLWVGAWGWSRVYPTIAGLSEWDEDFPGGDAAPDDDDGTTAAPAVDPYDGSMLMGMIEPDGTEHWVTVPGSPPAAKAS